MEHANTSNHPWMLVKLALELCILSIVQYNIHIISNNQTIGCIYIYLTSLPLHQPISTGQAITYHYHIKYHYSICNKIIFHEPPISWKEMILDHFPRLIYTFRNGTCSIKVKKHPAPRRCQRLLLWHHHDLCQPQSQTISQQTPGFIILSKNIHALLIHRI